MKKLLLPLMLMPLLALAGNDNLHFGARSAGMAHSSVTLSDVWSTHHNQAGLAWFKTPQAGVFFQNRFMLKNLNYMGFAYAHPTKSGAFGISYTSFGSKLYGESKAGLSYAIKFNDKISGGVQMNYHNTRILNYGSTSAFTIELGMQAKLTKKLMIGAHLFNPTRTKMANYNDERIPTIFRMGLNYKFSDKVFMTTEVEKDIDYRAVFRAGIEYMASDKVYFRGGVGTNPTLAAFGLGVKLENFQFDIASTYHQVLGFTPEISLNYNFSK